MFRRDRGGQVDPTGAASSCWRSVANHEAHRQGSQVTRSFPPGPTSGGMGPTPRWKHQRGRKSTMGCISRNPAKVGLASSAGPFSRSKRRRHEWLKGETQRPSAPSPSRGASRDNEITQDGGRDPQRGRPRLLGVLRRCRVCRLRSDPRCRARCSKARAGGHAFRPGPAAARHRRTVIMAVV